MIEPGECFGELAVLADGDVRTASVTALTDLRGLVLTAHFMHELRERLPGIGAQIDAAARERLQSDAQRAASA